MTLDFLRGVFSSDSRSPIGLQAIRVDGGYELRHGHRALVTARGEFRLFRTLDALVSFVEIQVCKPTGFSPIGVFFRAGEAPLQRFQARLVTAPSSGVRLIRGGSSDA